MSEKTLFLLVPPGGYTTHMPNMGDRALHEGIRTLWQKCHHGTRIFDEWNSFPLMTWKRLSKGGTVDEKTLEALHARFRRQSEKPAKTSRVMSDLLFGPVCAWLPIWPYLDRKAGNSTGQTGREALRPRLFPAHAARNFADRLGACDAVVMNAGGLLADHLSHYLPGRIFALHAALKAGRPTAIVNYSFAVSRPELLRWLAPVMRKITLHAVREGVSKERLLQIGVEEKRIVVVSDSAFAAPVAPVLDIAERKPVIALQARGDCQQDIEAWAGLAARLRERFHARIEYLAGCRKHDQRMINALTARGALDSAMVPNSTRELMKAVGASRVLITDRYHGVVFATQTGTPFVPIAGTTHKTAGLLQAIDYPLPARPRLHRDKIDAVMDDVRTCLDTSKDISARLREHAQTSRERLERDYREIIRRLCEQEENN